MGFSVNVLRSDELAIYELRSLYESFGYSGFKVSRFEEYDLYAHNKSFLLSDNILSFTDTNGKLMALKPDVTLSIIKNIAEDTEGTHKVYYNENVYRPSAESHGFKEIMQTGLECVGRVDILAESEVIMLAAKSLESISKDYMLDVSHMGLVEGLLDLSCLSMAHRAKLMEYIKSKNTTLIKRLCEEECVDRDVCSILCALTDTYENLDKTLGKLASSVRNEKMIEALEELEELSKIMGLYGLSERLYFDFSIVNDCNYYDGVIFKGFINGIPDSVLSGGRYDRLLSKMGKQSEAIGFAVYLDRLERFGENENTFDADALVVYDSDVSPADVVSKVTELRSQGMKVRISPNDDGSVRYRQLYKITNGGVMRSE